MSVELQKQRILYTGNGTATTFAFPFTIEEASQVRVVAADASGNERDLALGTEYTVSINTTDSVVQLGNGSVTLAAPLPAGYKLAIVSAIPETQQRSFPNNTPYYQEQVEGGIDKNTRLIQQISERLGRALLAPVTSNMDGNEIYAEKLLEASREAIEAKDYIGSLNIEKLDPLTKIPNEIAAVAGIADKIPPVAENAHDLSVIADDLRGMPLLSMDLGYVTEPNESINSAQTSILAQLVENADAIADIADHLDELLGIVSTAQAAAAEARQSASSAMASEARIQSLEDETRELIATNYAEVLNNAN